MKRLIFTLLHRDGHYLLSRNFRLQRVGDIDWVLRNYAIRSVSLGIDELMVLDLSESDDVRERFREEVRILGEECFVPLAVGGRIRSVDEVERLLTVGADKVVLNEPFVCDPGLCEAIAARFGSQALVAGIDVRREVSLAPGVREGLLVTPEELVQRVDRVLDRGAGEVLLQSVDRDGTGNGLDLTLADGLGDLPVPLILMGGVGHAHQIVEGLQHPAVDAVATANLFNFVGDALVEARLRCLDAGVALPGWDRQELARLEGCLASDGGR
jgi:cyclase